MREQLTDIAHCGRLWAVSRASYMLSVMDQLDSGDITQAQVTAWMWDVIRNLNNEADNEEIRAELEGLAVQLGQLPV
jgi:hypothetical protein